MQLLGAVLIFVGCYSYTFASDLKVSVYYEALCSDSVQFITKQLFPTFKELGTDIDVDLIPFGNAEASNSTGKWKFTCQHGPRECYGNMVQSCALTIFPLPDAVHFVNCAMGSSDPSSSEDLKQCSNETGQSWDSIQQCISTGQGSKLLAAYGARTDAVEPPIRFVPTIIFNDVFDQELQDEALDNLEKTVCELLYNQPKACRSEEDSDISVTVV